MGTCSVITVEIILNSVCTYALPIVFSNLHIWTNMYHFMQDFQSIVNFFCNIELLIGDWLSSIKY